MDTLLRLRKSRPLVLLFVVLIAALAFACGSSPPDEPVVPPQQPLLTPTFPPTVVPPSIPTSAPEQVTHPQFPQENIEGIERGGHLRVLNGGNGFPSKWDFSQTSTWPSLFHYGGRVYNGLLQFSPRDGVEIWSDMAESWEVRNDSRQFIFHIDPDLTEWHDGTIFDVDDVIFALNRWKNPPEGVIQPRVGGFALIDTMRKVDDRTLEINLTEPFADFIAEAANPWHMVIPRHVLEANDNTIPSWELIIGTGPYKMVNVEDGISVDTVRNENYFRDAPNGDPYPYLDRVTSITIFDPQAQISALRAKQADATKPTFNVSHVEYQYLLDDFPGEATFKIEPSLDMAAVQLNNESPPFNRLDARKAVFYGVNKQGIIDAEGAENPVFPASWFGYFFPSQREIIDTVSGYKPENRIQESETAKSFAEAASLTEFELITVSERTHHGELIAQDLLDCCDIDVEIRVQDWDVMLATVEGRSYQAAIGGTASSYGSITPLADILYSPGGGHNGGWNPPANYIEAWNGARTLPSGPERDELFRRMHDIMLNAWIPTVPYLSENQNKFHWNYVHGWDLVVQEVSSNNKFEDVWLDSNAHTK